MTADEAIFMEEARGPETAPPRVNEATVEKPLPVEDTLEEVSISDEEEA
jgi:hypothetical protein